MKLKEIDVLEIDKHDLIECITNYQALGYYFRGWTQRDGYWGSIWKNH